MTEVKKYDRVELEKNLSLVNAVTIVVGTIIGSGIFLTPSSVLEFSGSVGTSLLVWLFCGLYSTLGALCYAEIGTTIPKSGGDYSYLMHYFGPIPAFLFLWVNIMIIRPVAIAIVTIVFGLNICQPFFSSPPSDEVLLALGKLIAALAILTLSAANCFSVKLATKVQDYFTFTKISALVVLIISGIVFYFKKGSTHFVNAFEGTNGVSQISLAFYNGLFAFGGWNFLNFVTEEMRNPFRDLPLAIVIGLPLVTGIYLLTNVAYIIVLNPAIMLSSSTVAFEFVSHLFPPNSLLSNIFLIMMPIFVAFSAFGGANGIMFTSGRLLYVGSQNGHLPVIASMISRKKLTPSPAIILLTLMSLLYLFSQSLGTLINFFSFIFYLFVLLVICGLLYHRFKFPNIARPIKFNIVFHLIFLLCTSFLVIVPCTIKYSDVLIGLSICLSGLPVYYLCVFCDHKPAAVNTFTAKMTRFLQIILDVVPQDVSTFEEQSTILKNGNEKIEIT